MKQSHHSAIDLRDPSLYFNREISWLDFNDRVLHEAVDPRTPLLERLKFAAIYSSNLDEFFMVRVSTVMEQIEAGVGASTIDGMEPQALMNAIRARLTETVTAQHRLFHTELRPALAKVGVHLLDYTDLSVEQRDFLHAYFVGHVFPVLTPLSVDAAHPFPKMANLSLNLAVVVEDPESGVQKFARVKVPDTLSRFVALPDALSGSVKSGVVWTGVALEQVIASNVQALFPGMKIIAQHLFRITRDADFPVKEDEADDLLLAIAEEVRKRRTEGFVCRLEIENSMPASLREKLMADLEIGESEIYEVEGLLHLKDLFFFLSMPLPQLKDAPWSGAGCPSCCG